ncbi:MAG: FHA domain-containing protein [Planctomycetaceae bacterium]|nr:FHA domain-containing protein [Planctomycetaceae bacterium]
MSLTAVAARVPPTGPEEETLLLLANPSFLPSDGILLTPGRWSFGSDPSNDVVLTQTGVQARHLQILVGRRHVIVKAWDRRTWLNDSPVQEASLRPGDQITLGPVTLRCERAAVDDLLRQVPSATTNDVRQAPPIDSLSTKASQSSAATVPTPNVAPAAAESRPRTVAPSETPAEETPGATRDPIEQTAPSLQLASAIRELDDREAALRKLAHELAATEARLNRERDLFWEESLAWESTVKHTRDELNRSSSDLEERARRLQESEIEADRRAEDRARQFALLASRDDEFREIRDQAADLAQRRQKLDQLEDDLSTRAISLRTREEHLERARIDLDERMRVFESRQRELERQWSEDEHRLKSARIAVDELIDALESELLQQQAQSEQLTESQREQARIESDRAEQDRLFATREAELREQARRQEDEQSRLQQISRETEEAARRHRDEQTLLEAERVWIRQEADQLASERADWEQARRQWAIETEQHAAARRSLDARAAELSTLRDTLERREASLATRENWTSCREAELTRAAEELDQAQTERETLTAEIADRQHQLVKREAELERRREHLEGELARRAERQAELEQQLAERIARQTEEQSLGQARLIEERDRLADQQGEIEELRAKLARNEQSLLAREKTTEQELGRLREQLEAERAARQVLEARLEEVAAERSSLEARLADLATREHEQDAPLSETETTGHAAEITELEARQTSLLQRQAELDASRQALDQRDEALAQQSRLLQDEQRKLEEERAEFERANAELGERNARLENLASELTAREHVLAEQTAELDAAREGLEASRLEIEALIRSVELDRRITDAENQQREQELRQRETELAYQQQKLEEATWDLSGSQALLEWREELETPDVSSAPVEPSHAWPEPWNWTPEAAPSLPGQRILFQDEFPTEARDLPFDVESLLITRAPVDDDKPATLPRQEADESDSVEAVGSLRAELAKMFDLPGSPFDKQPDTSSHELIRDSLAVDDDSFAKELNSETGTPVEPADELPVRPVVAYEAPEAEPTSGEDDQSVSAYMNRLLNRLNRGGSVPPESVASKPVPAPITRPQVSEAIPETVSPSSISQSPISEEPPPPTPPPRKPIDRTSDRLQVSSFREVANLSARTAVARHQWQRLRSVVTVKAILATACLLTGAILSFGPLIGGQRMWLQGAACLILGIFAGYDLYRTLVKSRVLIPRPLASTAAADRFSELTTSEPPAENPLEQQAGDNASND